MLQICSKNTSITFPKLPKTSDPDLWEIQNAVIKMEVWMNFIKDNLKDIRTVENNILQASLYFNAAHNAWLELIGPGVETCIMRPSRVLKALIYKDVMEKILKKRFSDKEVNSMILEINESKITDTHPSVNLYNNGLKIDSIKELAETLL